MIEKNDEFYIGSRVEVVDRSSGAYQLPCRLRAGWAAGEQGVIVDLDYAYSNNCPDAAVKLDSGHLIWVDLNFLAEVPRGGGRNE